MISLCMETLPFPTLLTEYPVCTTGLSPCGVGDGKESGMRRGWAASARPPGGLRGFLGVGFVGEVE